MGIEPRTLLSCQMCLKATSLSHFAICADGRATFSLAGPLSPLSGHFSPRLATSPLDGQSPPAASAGPPSPACRPGLGPGPPPPPCTVGAAPGPAPVRQRAPVLRPSRQERSVGPSTLLAAAAPKPEGVRVSIIAKSRDENLSRTAGDTDATRLTCPRTAASSDKAKTTLSGKAGAFAAAVDTGTAAAALQQPTRPQYAAIAAFLATHAALRGTAARIRHRVCRFPLDARTRSDCRGHGRLRRRRPSTPRSRPRQRRRRSHRSALRLRSERASAPGKPR